MYNFNCPYSLPLNHPVLTAYDRKLFSIINRVVIGCIHVIMYMQQYVHYGELVCFGKHLSFCNRFKEKRLIINFAGIVSFFGSSLVEYRQQFERAYVHTHVV